MNYSRKVIEPILHIAFWGMLVLLLSSMTRIIFSPAQALMMSVSRVTILVVVAYMHAFFIIPRLFQKRKFIWYTFVILALAILAVLAHVWLSELWELDKYFPPLRDRSVEFQRNPAREFMRYIPPFFSVFTALLISSVYTLTKEYLKKEQQASVLEKEKIKHELNFLRSQINPHFLFNALNNLYATIQLNPNDAGDFILKLGEMLRYVLEDCKKDKVSLADEIKYIENYIFFQQQKDDNLQNIQLDIKGDEPATYHLEPMLLIALVENAFTHSYTKKTEDQYVIMNVDLNDGTLQFSIRNNLSTDAPPTPLSERKEHGVGISNIKRRLKLLYPERHTFTHGIQDQEYRAELMINK